MAGLPLWLLRARQIRCPPSRAAPSSLFFAAVPQVGNYLNGGTNRGQADGFDLETLGKLEGIKDAAGKDVRASWPHKNSQGVLKENRNMGGPKEKSIPHDPKKDPFPKIHPPR